MAKWRLKLDEPFAFAVEKGYIYTRLSADARQTPGAFNGTYQCPLTDVIMLNPSFRSRDFTADFKGLDQWRVKQTDGVSLWKEVKRSTGGGTRGSMFTAEANTTGGFSLIELLVDVAIIALTAAIWDTMIWVAESNFSLMVDEGFCIHYHGLTDELARKENWFMVQWDNIGLHFSQSGKVRVYSYLRETLNAPGVLVEEFQIADAGELLNRHGYFVFIPIPAFGLAIYHSTTSRASNLVSSNTSQTVQNGGHLVKAFPTREVDGAYRIFEASTVRLGKNPYQSNVLGFQSITYPANGTYTDAPFNVPYTHASNYDELQYLSVPTGFGLTDISLRNTDDTAGYVANVGEARMKLALTSTFDRKRTPFVYAWLARWLPVIVDRNTTPVTFDHDGLDLLWDWEFTEDERGHKEGTAQVKAESAAAQSIVERGDTTFLLEYSLNNGVDWIAEGGGLAKAMPGKTITHKEGGFWYEASWQLNGMEERLVEGTNSDPLKFDGMTFDNAINFTLTTQGFTAIPLSAFPAEANNRAFPRVVAGEKHFRFGVRPGDNGKQIIEKILFMLSYQSQEFLCVFNLTTRLWGVTRKPIDDAATRWTLSALHADKNEANRIGVYREFTPEFIPPEFNQLVVVGLSTTERDESERVESKPLINNDSLSNTSSVDYLGRVKTVKIEMVPLSDQSVVDEAARKIFNRVAYRVIEGVVKLPPGDLYLSLRPNIGVIIKKTVGSDYPVLYVKKRTIEGLREENGMGENERVTLHLSQRYETEIRI